MSALYEIGLCLKTSFPHYKKANKADKHTVRFLIKHTIEIKHVELKTTPTFSAIKSSSRRDGVSICTRQQLTTLNNKARSINVNVHTAINVELRTAIPTQWAIVYPMIPTCQSSNSTFHKLPCRLYNCGNSETLMPGKFYWLAAYGPIMLEAYRHR